MDTKVIHIKDAPAGWEKDANFVYIGRGKGSIWGNPFEMGKPDPRTGMPMTRNDVCELFEKYFLNNKKLLQEVSKLKGKTLVCFCKKKGTDIACHGDTYVRYA